MSMEQQGPMGTLYSQYKNALPQVQVKADKLSNSSWMYTESFVSLKQTSSWIVTRIQFLPEKHVMAGFMSTWHKLEPFERDLNEENASVRLAL